MTKICKHCGHAKCYHNLKHEYFRGPYCEFCAEQIHTVSREMFNGLTWEEIMSKVDDMATHEFEEVKPEHKYLFVGRK